MIERSVRSWPNKRFIGTEKLSCKVWAIKVVLTQLRKITAVEEKMMWLKLNA